MLRTLTSDHHQSRNNSFHHGFENTVVIDTLGQAMFASYIERGLMHSADMASDIINVLKKIHSRKNIVEKKHNHPSVNKRQKNNLMEFLQRAV